MNRDRLHPGMPIPDALVEACMNMEHSASGFETICPDSIFALSEYTPLKMMA